MNDLEEGPIPEHPVHASRTDEDSYVSKAFIRIASDVGGTFTDSLAYDENLGIFQVSKVPTTPEDRALGTVQGMGAALAKLGKTGREVSYVGHGMTTATNAVIQRKGAKNAFVGNQGFRDLLEIGRL